MNRHPANAIRRRQTVRRLVLARAIPVLLCLAIPACGTDDARRPKGATLPLAPPQSRLVFNLPALASAAADYRRYTSADGRFLEEFATWNGGRAGPGAGLLISEANNAPPLLDAESPEQTVDLWSALRDKKPGLGPLKQARNANGPVDWRRASIGTRICVLFLQRLADGGAAAPGRQAVLTGYYCNPPGAILAPDTAEAAVTAAGLRAPPPAQ